MRFRTIKNYIIPVFMAFLLAVSYTVSGIAYAADGGIMEELSGMTINGTAFDVSAYPADDEGVPQLITLYEGGYSYYANKQDNYGLLVYIYNPSQIDVHDDVRNMVQIKSGSAARYDKYKLKLLEVSADKLFCKFRIEFTGEEKEYVLSTLESESRVYEVSSIEIYESGTNATSYPIERIFTYTGYEEGYGAGGGESTVTATLSWTEEGGTATIPFEVKHTTWRPEGTNGNSEYTQDTLHSVYFAIPSETANQYDYLNSVKVQWIEARLAPMLVTSNKEVLEACARLMMKNVDIAEILGNDLPETFDFTDFDWHFVSAREPGFASAEREVYFGNDTWFNSYNTVYEGEMWYYNQVRNRINSLYLFAYTERESKVLTSSEVEKAVNEATANLRFSNDKKVDGKYPSILFESWDSELHTEIIKKGEKDKELNLTSGEVQRSLWERIIGSSHLENVQPYEEIEAIKKVTSITGDMETDCNSLYISENDYDEFKEFYNDNKDNSTIYLLRFAISEYWRAEVAECQTGALGVGVINSYGYLAQDNCYLHFDFIDLEYIKDDKSYVIPVNMSPIDIFPEYTPPPSTRVSDFWKYGCGMIGGLIAVYAVYRVALKTIKRR